jgi:hypothetical protein
MRAWSSLLMALPWESVRRHFGNRQDLAQLIGRAKLFDVMHRGS